MDQEKEKIINDFNSTALTLAQSIAIVCPTSIIGRNISIISTAINNKNNRTKFIDIFTTKVLIYKSEIMAGDENYFLNKSYDDIGYDTSNIFEFKDIWTKLNKNNKNTIIQYMQILCMLSEKYLSFYI
jgi:hypothetical protein